MFRIKKLIVSMVYLLLSLVIKRKPEYVALGSWKGELYIDNSRYLAEYISQHRKDIIICWVGNKEIKDVVTSHLDNVVFVKRNSFVSSIKLLKCKYMFFSQMHNADISSFNVYRGAVLCYLHHGFPIKKWGLDGLNERTCGKRGVRKIATRICGNLVKYDYFISSSPLQDQTNCSALRDRGCTMEKNVHSGTPRNDCYFSVDDSHVRAVKEDYSKALGFDCSKRIIVYLPTYRRTDTFVFSFTRLDKSRRRAIEQLLEENNCILIEKSHFAETDRCNLDNNDEKIIGCSNNVNVQDLMLISDCLISDYSGAFLDYLLLNRPIIHYAYDYEYYRDVDSGLYYEIEDFSAGPIARDFENLLEVLKGLLKGDDGYSEKREYVKNKYMTYEQGNASEQIVDTVIGPIKKSAIN